MEPMISRVWRWFSFFSLTTIPRYSSREKPSVYFRAWNCRVSYCIMKHKPSCTHRTERVKSPGLLLLGRAKKLPSTPRVSRRFSASTPVMFGWNHLWRKFENPVSFRSEFTVAALIRIGLSESAPNINPAKTRRLHWACSHRLLTYTQW